MQTTGTPCRRLDSWAAHRGPWPHQNRRANPRTPSRLARQAWSRPAGRRNRKKRRLLAHRRTDPPQRLALAVVAIPVAVVAEAVLVLAVVVVVAVPKVETTVSRSLARVPLVVGASLGIHRGVSAMA